VIEVSPKVGGAQQSKAQPCLKLQWEWRVAKDNIRVSSWGDRNNLKLDWGDSGTAL
jgi:hypothetical protein